MALYDDYITHDDKPFAENINDALLLSNVFDMTVQVDAPEMFSNQTWVNTTSPRKCSVSVLQLKEALPSGVSVSTSNNKSVLTGTGTVKLGWYPNFNAFGKYKSISWTGTGTIKVNLKTTNGTTIANDIANGTITSESVELRKLQEIVIEIVLTNATLTGLSVVMENKQSTRYGATVGITDVTGLDDRLTAIETFDNNIFDLIYPVGSIYMSVNNTSPQTLFGGTWEQLKDKFLLASGDTYTAGNTGGEATHTLTQNEMPSHTHTQNSHSHTTDNHYHYPSTLTDYFVTSEEPTANNTRVSYNASGNRLVDGQQDTSSSTFHHRSATSSEGVYVNGTRATNQNTGGGQSHNNMPPYLAVYVWKRTA